MLGLAETGAWACVADLDLAATRAVAKEVSEAGDLGFAYEIDRSR